MKTIKEAIEENPLTESEKECLMIIDKAYKDFQEERGKWWDDFVLSLAEEVDHSNKHGKSSVFIGDKEYYNK